MNLTGDYLQTEAMASDGTVIIQLGTSFPEVSLGMKRLLTERGIW